jgi:hypothetical protein
LSFVRPDEDDLFSYVDFSPLFCLMEPDNIISIFASLLVERRVIFVARKLSNLSSCIQACVALLYPFTWQVRETIKKKKKETALCQ